LAATQDFTWLFYETVQEIEGCLRGIPGLERQQKLTNNEGL
jgi:hypothetical protein